MRHFPLRELGYAIGFILFFAAMYVGGYYATVYRQLTVNPIYVDDHGDIVSIDPLYPEYKINLVAGFFRPMYEIDRKIRPDFWTTESFIRDIFGRK